MAEQSHSTNPSIESLDGPYATLDELIAATNARDFSDDLASPEVKLMAALLRRCDAEALANGFSGQAARDEGLRVFIRLLEAGGPS
jgi:hypothetical protein